MPDSDRLIDRDEAAVILGVAPESVRKTLSRAGVALQHGYRLGDVLGVQRVGRERRTDLKES